MPPFLLEVGTEELPSGAIAPAAEQLKNALRARLEAEQLPVAENAIRTWATPRRLAVFVADLPARQPDTAVEARGPSVKAAFGPDGAPTPAAQGFARKQGVAVEELVREGEYVLARKTVAGKETGEVLAAAIPDLLREITFPKFMRWGAGNYRWGRPLRGFVALLGDDIVPFEVEGIASGRQTRGHRYHPEPVTIYSPDGYADALRAAHVEPDPDVRREQIRAQANALAAEIGGRALLDDALVEENVYLTEWVTATLGAFDPDYLALPRPVLETAMKKHQRFFPVEGKDGALLPHFVAIRSGGAEHLNTVRTGYENVLASRFNDARFFFDHDRETPLSAKLFKTERIVFQEKLGTLADKTKRLLSLMEQTGLLRWTGDERAARRAAQLAKADLASEMVMELPALQGVMGREYARLDNEPASVGEALAGQYLPRFAGDALPASRIGTALALADRTDTLVGYLWFVGAEPKGSSDPFGLKRAATAIVDLLARDGSLPGIAALVAAAADAYQAQGLEQASKPGDLTGLLATRLRGLLEERGVRYDLIDALLAAPWDNIASVAARADALSTLLRTAEEVTVAQAATRVRNILRGVAEVPAEPPRPSELTTPEERALSAFLDTITPPIEKDLVAGEITDALDTLAALNAPINRFFDTVLVMAEDPDVRRARLALLARADRLYLRFADFSKLVLEG